MTTWPIRYALALVMIRVLRSGGGGKVRSSPERRRVMGMRKTVLLLVPVTVALLLAGAVTLFAPKERAEAAFPGTSAKITFLSDRDGNNEIYTISFSDGKWGNPKRLT